MWSPQAGGSDPVRSVNWAGTFDPSVLLEELKSKHPMLFDWTVVDAVDYEVPQHRKRIIAGSPFLVATPARRPCSSTLGRPSSSTLLVAPAATQRVHTRSLEPGIVPDLEASEVGKNGSFRGLLGRHRCGAVRKL